MGRRHESSSDKQRGGPTSTSDDRPVPVEAIAKRSDLHREAVEEAHSELHKLLDSVASYVKGSVKHAAAMAAVASLAVVMSLGPVGCSSPSPQPQPTAQPQNVEVEMGETKTLEAEVSEGLPPAKGVLYTVEPSSVTRDEKGVFHFKWAEKGSAEFHEAAASNLMMRASENEAAELSLDGWGNPTLALPASTQVQLVWARDVSDADPASAAAQGTPQPGATPTATPTDHHDHYVHDYHYGGFFYPYGYYYSYWSPFNVGVVSSHYTPSYYNPPTGAALRNGGSIDGAVTSKTAPSFSDRAMTPTKSSSGGGIAVTGKPAVAKGTKTTVTVRPSTSASSSSSASGSSTSKSSMTGSSSSKGKSSVSSSSGGSSSGFSSGKSGGSSSGSS